MLVKLAQTIYSKYYNLFPLNLIITIIVILLDYSTVCSGFIIVLHQARGLLPIVDLRFTFSGLETKQTKQDRDFKRLFIQEMKSSGATVGFWKLHLYEREAFPVKNTV